MKRSKFNLSFPLQTTFNAGYLVPFLVQDTLPNDTFYISARSFIRAQPMTAPLLHDVDVFLQYFYCPERILWDNAPAFFLGTNEVDGLASPTRPYIKAPAEGFAVGSLADYLGVPTPTDENDPTGKNIKFSAIPFRAYAKVWNDKYRDDRLQDEIPISYEDGLDEITSVELKSPTWKNDYFHKAEVQKQLGEGVTVPIVQATGDISEYFHYTFSVGFVAGDGRHFIQEVKFPGTHPTDKDGTAVVNAIKAIASPPDIVLNALYYLTWDGKVSRGWVNGKMQPPPQGAFLVRSLDNVDYYLAIKLISKELEKGTQTVAGWADSRVSVDKSIHHNVWTFRLVDSSVSYHTSSLATSGALSIENLSQATHMQRFQERMLKVQDDYRKYLKNIYGFDLRSDVIDEPQYLGGSRAEIVFSEVLQTSEGQEGGVGSMYGHGVGRAKQRPIKFRCPEHGVILGLISVRPRFAYSQGIDRAWARENRFDFFLPDFTDIGMQEVMQQELMATADNAKILFGYTPRFEEYRARFPKINGMFKKELADWNMAIKFATPPSLNGSFVDMAGGASGFKRPFVVPSEHQYLMYLYNRITAVRNVPKYASRTKI